MMQLYVRYQPGRQPEC